MSVHNWIRTALLVLLMVHNGAFQSCSIPFEAVIASVTDQVVPASSLQFGDPEMRFYIEILRFTTEEINQEMENAIQYFTTEFVLTFPTLSQMMQTSDFFQLQCLDLPRFHLILQ